MSKISVKSPTRVDLAGGTLDLWPLYMFVGGAKTINVAIDIFSSAEIEKLDDNRIILESLDLGLKKEYPDLQSCLSDRSELVSLLKSQISYWKPKHGFHLTTKSNSPIGAGLGGSSSLTISIMKAFARLTETDFSSSESMVNVAHNIEAQVLNTPTGTQDYFPAIKGGLNIMSYGAFGVHHECIPVGATPMDQHFLLVYTGKAHHSGLNNFEVMQKAVGKDPRTMEALYELKHIAEQTEHSVRQKDWMKLPDLFKQEFAARVKLAPAFSSPEIERLESLTLSKGAEAVKICGAGGGGCVLVWVSPGKKESVAKACLSEGFQVLEAKPVDL
jgi:D-glycero-alpha-D-manno-heptose-7-phosphate kinase